MKELEILESGVKNRSRGFSLIELLVAITVLTLLTSIAISSYRNSQRNSRDARRRGDMTALQQAFEQYYIDNTSSYNATCSSMTATYIQGAYPTDPVNSAPYEYAENCTADTYCLCARLEIEGKGNSIDGACDFTGAGTKNWFCVQNQQ
jgi:prepilin-type N-terminal cleavage/methylation domain-containing protein